MYVNFRKCSICLKKKKTTKLETPPPPTLQRLATFPVTEKKTDIDLSKYLS